MFPTVSVPVEFRGKRSLDGPYLIRGDRETGSNKLMHETQTIRPRYVRLGRAVVLGMAACAAVASDNTLPVVDMRGARLEAFFKAYDCPSPLHVDEYLKAADSHDVDYRLLPAISLVESTCGAFERRNNRWGWDSVQSGFPSVPAGIEYITEQLAENPHYKGKSIREKLFTYNPYPPYVRQVERLMHQIED